MIDYSQYYFIINSIPEEFKIIANLWGIRDPLIGPIVVMIVVFIFYYLIILLGLEGSFGRLGTGSKSVLKLLAVVIAIMLMFGLAPLAVLLFGNPFVALAFLIIAILIYSRSGLRRPY